MQPCSHSYLAYFQFKQFCTFEIFGTNYFWWQFPFWNGKATQLMRLTHDTYFSQTRHWNNRGRICAQLVLNLSLSEQGWYQTNVVFAFQKQIFELLLYIHVITRENQCKSIWYYSTIYINEKSFNCVSLFEKGFPLL